MKILKHLIDKGTISFVDAYSDDYYFDSPDAGCKDNYPPTIDNLLAVVDPFLLCLLLQQNIKERYATDAFKKSLEKLSEKYKDTYLLSLKKQTISDLDKILRSLWDGKTAHDIDLAKLYKDLQKLTDLKPDE